MAKIYTKTGDKGQTGLFGGGRVKKSAPRIRAYGEVDEANAFLGAARSASKDSEVERLLERIQNDLFDIGALLATPDKTRLAGRTFLAAGDVDFLEKAIDHYDAELPPLKNFILAGGAPLAAALHLARTVVRRAEREVVALSEKEAVEPEVIVYLNRLSDLLFVLARWANHKAGIADVPWRQKS